MPEGIDKIMGHLNKVIDETPDCSGTVDSTFKIFEFNNFKDFENWLKNILEQVREYHELNVSRKLKEQGIKAGDPENSGIMFISRYDSSNLAKRYTDFIDLDALIGNISVEINNQQQIDDDCFLCKYAKEYGSIEPGDERCVNCICNPKIKYYRETHPMALKPKKDWTPQEIKQYKL